MVPLLLSGHSQKVSNEKMFDIGIKASASKPVTMEELTTLVRKVLDEGKGSGQN